MDSNINNKTTPNQMRVFMKRMRDGFVVESTKPAENKTLSMRDMLKITRNLNEQVEDKSLNKKTVYDQSREEENFRNYFNDLNVNVKFIELEVYDNLIFWGGTIDGVIQFIYKVTPNEKTAPEFNYLEDFSPDNPENEEIINRVEAYYELFFRYWKNNMLQK
jgi:hypothetical protein